MGELELRFCTAKDGTRIAYAMFGAGTGRPVILIESWAFPMAATWDRRYGQRNLLAMGRPVVVFDRRGTGMSARDVCDIGLDAQVTDVMTIIGELNLKQVDLFGFGDGCAIAMAVAAKFPRRVRRLVLWGAFIRGADLA